MRFCTVREEDATRQCAQCALCADAIYEGEEFYRINGEAICCSCLEDYARAAFAPFLCKGGEAL